MTMREKLIEAAEATVYVGDKDRDGFQRVKNWPDVIDAILTTLREPDPSAMNMLRDMIEEGGGPVVAWGDYGEAFTAMIDHFRNGK